MFIAIEGANGAGKTTLINKLTTYLDYMNVPYVITSWNSYPPTNKLITDEKAIRGLTPETHFLSHLLDLQFRVDKVIKPALLENKWVIADRYIPTTYVRDGIRGVSEEVLRITNQLVPAPELYVFLDTDYSVILNRMSHQKRSDYITGVDIYGGTKETALPKYLSSQVRKYRLYFKKNRNVPVLSIKNNNSDELIHYLEERKSNFD